jgi:hypothetical protein
MWGESSVRKEVTMLKKSLFVVATVALLAAAAQAGEIKIHDWPMTEPQPIPQDVCTIDVIMDIGYWIECVNQDDNLELIQRDIHEYDGCLVIEMKSNFAAHLSASISATGAIPGDYSVTKLDPADIPAGTTNVELCVKLANADIGAQAGGTDDVHVATVTISVVPQ